MKQLLIAAFMSMTLFSVGCAHKHHGKDCDCGAKQEKCACGHEKSECKDGECGMKKEEEKK